MQREMPEKRKVKKPGIFGKLLAMLPVTCALLYPVYLAAQLEIKEEDYINSRIPRAFSGLKLVYLSDIHYGYYFRADRVQKLVDTVNALQPDLILLGGDYGEDSQGAVDFFRLKPAFRAKIGVFGVMGNHDRTLPESNLIILQEEMKKCGVTPLVNDTALIRRQGASLAIAGMDDYYNGYPDLKKLEEQCRGADFVIFLPHTPDVLPEVEAPFFDLALCGHTHGGQVTIFGYAPKCSSHLGNRYLSGWFHERGYDFLVSNGVGVSWLPVRLGAKAQVHLLTLKKQ